jgi:DNA modification methylase
MQKVSDVETDKNKMIKLNHIYCGNAIDILKTFDKESVDMCITSPPYYNLRLYLTKPVVYGGDPECEHDFSLPTAGGDFRENKVSPNTSVGANKAMLEYPGLKHKPGETNPGKEAWYKDEGGLGHYIHRGTTKSDILTDGVITDGFVAEALCSKCGAWRGSLGNEDTISRYITNLVSVFDEVWRVLKNTASLWVNISDTYWGGGHGGNTLYSTLDGDVKSDKQGKSSVYVPIVKWDGSYKSKCLCLIPERFAIAMVDRGWILRQTVIWHKTNSMPQSCKDRFSTSYEYLYHFTKQGKYYFQQQFEPFNWDTMRRSKCRYAGKKAEIFPHHGFDNQSSVDWAERLHSGQYVGRNMRNVWSIPTISCYYDFCNDCGKLFVSSDRKNITIESYTDDRGLDRRRRVCTCGSSTGWVDHFASYPRTLIETPIRATCPEQICVRCGKIKEPILDKIKVGYADSDTQYPDGYNANNLGKKRQAWRKIGLEGPPIPTISKYSDCGCDSGFHSGVVLDPFMGSGTTAIEAISQGKQYVGIDLSEKYVNLANARIEHFRNNPDKPKKVKADIAEDFDSRDNSPA